MKIFAKKELTRLIDVNYWKLYHHLIQTSRHGQSVPALLHIRPRIPPTKTAGTGGPEPAPNKARRGLARVYTKRERGREREREIHTYMYAIYALHGKIEATNGRERETETAKKEYKTATRGGCDCAKGRGKERERESKKHAAPVREH